MADEPKIGSLVHVELVSKEPEKTKKFYSDVFGWKFEDVPDMNYSMFETPDPPGGGLRKPEEQEGAGTLTYVLVASVDDILRKAERAGAKVLMGKTEVPGMGWTGIVQAPGGVLQGVWQPAPKQ